MRVIPRCSTGSERTDLLKLTPIFWLVGLAEVQMFCQSCHEREGKDRTGANTFWTTNTLQPIPVKPFKALSGAVSNHRKGGGGCQPLGEPR